MVPTSLSPAVFALAGVFVLLEVYVFHHFNENVRNVTRERLILMLTRESTKNLVKKLEGSRVPGIVISDFANEVLLIGEPMRRFRTLLMMIPITSLFLLCSGLLAWLEETVALGASFLIVIDLGAYAMLAAGVVLVICSAFAMARLGTELS
jgi:hypothetical protein